MTLSFISKYEFLSFNSQLVGKNLEQKLFGAYLSTSFRKLLFVKFKEKVYQNLEYHIFSFIFSHV